MDHTTFNREFVAHRVRAGFPSSHSPPYSPPYSPEATPQYPLSPSASISHRMRTVEESPSNESSSSSPEELGQRTSEPDPEHNSMSLSAFSYIYLGPPENVYLTVL